MVGRSVGRRGVRWRKALSDGGQRTGGSFYLEPPTRKVVSTIISALCLIIVANLRIDQISEDFKEIIVT